METAADPDAQVTATDMAETFGCTPEHFSRLFKQSFGESPKVFLIRTRIEAARNLLLSSAYSVSKIADMLGYRNVYFFSRQFKQKTGISPAAFRKNAHLLPISEEHSEVM